MSTNFLNKSTIYNRHERRHFALKKRFPTHQISSMPLSYISKPQVERDGNVKILEEEEEKPSPQLLCDGYDFLRSTEQLTDARKDSDFTQFINGDDDSSTTSAPNTPLPSLIQTTQLTNTSSPTNTQYLSYLFCGLSTLYITYTYN